MIAIIDGDTEDLRTAAAPLKKRNIQVFVIAVGVSVPSSRHLSLASSADHVYTVKSMADLIPLSAALVKGTCRGKLSGNAFNMKVSETYFDETNGTVPWLEHESADRYTSFKSCSDHSLNLSTTTANRPSSRLILSLPVAKLN